LVKQPLLIQHERARGIKLDNAALVHDDEPVISDDSVDSVGNGEHSGGLELLLNHVLNQMVSGLIDAGCRFIHDQHSTFAEDGSTHADQLSLA
jgi:hypothetical protein